MISPLDARWIRALAVSSATLSACACSRSEPAPPAGTTSADPVSVAPRGSVPAPSPGPSLRSSNYMFVSNEGANTISVIDATVDEVVATVAVGKRPRGLRTSPDGRLLFVALSGSPRGGPTVDESKLPPPDRSQDGIGIVDLESGRLSSTLQSGPDPEAFDVTPDGRMLYISNEDAARASIVDLQARSIAATVSVGGEPEGVSLSPDGRFAYIACEEANRVDVIDTERRERTHSIKTGVRPRMIVFTQDGALAYVSVELGGTVDVIDARHHRRLSSIALPGDTSPGRSKPLPMGLALSPDERSLYVSTGRGGGVAIVDTATRKLARMLPNVGARPWGIALSADGRKLYTANGPSDDVSVIDTESGAILKKIPTGRLPWGIVGAARPN